MSESNVQNKVVANISTWQEPWSYDHLKLDFQPQIQQIYFLYQHLLHNTHTH